ncbi:MAG: prepilin-type N-terminal cleavage/methylation domain-containing protein [Planctomycetota bacterium]|nr:prepilin-type N-terminal cleavage/methylation domain-containing protein [Planctomycetota bacterium]
MAKHSRFRRSRCPESGTRTPRAAGGAPGFTLVEILATLAVLLIGLGAVIAMVFGSQRQSVIASDRNAASILLADAVREIEQDHLITPEIRASYAGIADADVGLYIQTLTNAPQSDDIAAYGNVTAAGHPLGGDGNAGNLNEWPRRPAKALQLGSGQYRARYRLEKHPLWWPHDADGNEGAETVESTYRGIYVLTVVCYRDEDGNMNEPVQVSDPAVVYLKDRKLR